MYLAFDEIVTLFSDYKGIKNADHLYFTVTDNATSEQKRGLFIPLSDDSGDLQEAIANGAIAAIWDKNKQIPRYTPNHFPLFFTDNPIEAVRKLLKMYLEKIDGDNTEKMKMSKFVFLDKKLLNKSEDTYDIAVMLDKLSEIERRG